MSRRSVALSAARKLAASRFSGGSKLVIAALLAILAGTTLLGCSKGGPTDPGGGGSPGGSGNAFDSGSLSAPATFVHVFPAAGSVGYHCTFHRSTGMTGTVTVVAGAADSAAVATSGDSFVPRTVSVKPGGSVRWTITSSVHTVTSD